MKNTRNNRLPAFILAVIMVIGVLPATAVAGGSYIGPMGSYYTYTANDASFSFASDGKAVSSVAELDPNKTSTMTVTVPDSEGLPTNNEGVILVKVPDYVKVTADNASACDSNAVTCTYRSNTNQLAFKWSGSAQDGFSAVLTITPNAPATMPDVSGNKVLVVENNNTNYGNQPIIVSSELKTISNESRLAGIIGELYDNRIYAGGKEMTIWKIERISGDWYSISSNGKYMRYGDKTNNVSLVDTPYYFHYEKEDSGYQFVGFSAKGEKYYLNNKQNNVNNGLRASTYKDQRVKLYTKFETRGNEAFVSYSANGGTTIDLPKSVLTQKGETITLPEYKGTKKNNKFMGWALTNNVKVNVYYRIYQPGETFKITDSNTTIYAVWSSTTPEKAQFGIRLDRTIPDEPAQYDTSAYSKEHIVKESIVKDAVWIIDTNATGQAMDGNHIANAVTANLKTVPTDDEIKKIYPDYNPETMYVHWYVMKYAGGLWHVDGVIVMRNQEARIRYSANVSNDQKTKIKNIPAAYATENGSEIAIGADASGKQLADPTYPDHIFEGWTTTEDGSGEVFHNGDTYKTTGDVTFYAKWSEIQKYKVSYDLEDAPANVLIPETHLYEENGTVTIADAENINGYLFSGWMINGEKLDGSSFNMPKEDITITGVYYGPITIDIESDWQEGARGYWGAIVNLKAKLHGADGLDCTLQWQYLVDGNWVNWKEPTLSDTTSYELNEETSGRIWRVVVTDAKPHQD